MDTGTGHALSGGEEVARHLTRARRRVLEELVRCGPGSTTEIARCWVDDDAEVDAAFAGRLPAMVTDLVWRLVTLGWVAGDGDRYEITEAGRSALARAG